MNCALRFSPRTALVVALYCLISLGVSAATGTLYGPLGRALGLGFGLGGALLGLVLAVSGWLGRRR
jgi:hypothetical protein